MKKAFVVVLSVIVVSVAESGAMAQANRHQLREGNRQYKKEKYDQAEVSYRRALERDSTDFRGQYNLGNSLYRSGKYDEASRHYTEALNNPRLDAKRRAATLHNQGNSNLMAGKVQGESQMQYLQQAVKSYQEALKLDPKNDNTRYNLAYAMRLLQQAQQQAQQQQGGGDDNRQDNNQQQNQQQGQQNQEGKQDQQNSIQQQQDQRQEGKQHDNAQARQQDMKKQEAERTLEAVKNNERQTLREQQKQQKVAGAHHSDKDW